MSSLTFNALRQANIARLPEFKNSKGEPAHSEPDGSDWTPGDWMTAVVGELGELANWQKKYLRGDITADEWRIQAAKEIADVITYLDIYAQRCMDTRSVTVNEGIDMGEAVIAKFNEVSRRVGSRVRLMSSCAYNAAVCEHCNGIIDRDEDHDEMCPLHPNHPAYIPF